MGQGVAWAARELGVSCTVVVPEHAPETKLAAIERLGGRAVKVPYERWWQAIAESRFPEAKGVFVHPVQDERVMAGNGTIGLEILEDLPDADTVLVPFGGGGLSVGIASAVKALRPETGVYAVEPETGAPLTEAMATGEPRPFDYQVSFVDGSGSPALLPEMWSRAKGLLDGAFAVSLDATADAVRLLASRARVVAEGAGALALAAALGGSDEKAKVVCIVSGGNIDESKLAEILAGRTPTQSPM
jgi:threonine dehydratase